MQIRTIAIALLSLVSVSVATSCGSGKRDDSPSTADRAGEKGSVSTVWAKYSYMRVDPNAPEGACATLSFSLGNDGSWLEEKCGQTRMGEFPLNDVKPISMQIEEIMRGHLIHRCHPETVWRGEYFGDVAMPDGKSKRIISISAAGNCFLTEARTALRLGNAVERLWRRTLPPGEPVACAPNQPVCPGAEGDEQ